MDTDKGSNQPIVSVVIPTFNSAKTILWTINSILNQTYKGKIEIIVVDNYSSDHTRNLAQVYGAYVYVKGKERANQLDFGIRQAMGKYILETGSDMAVESTYIEEAVNKCEQEGYDAIYSQVKSAEQKSFWGKVKALERQTYIGSNAIEASHFIRRTVYSSLGGYDTRLISVEEDFQHRLDNAGYKTGRINASEFHFKESTTLKEIAMKSFYYGKYIRRYLRKHPKRGFKYLFPLRKEFLIHWWLFLRQPLLTCGFIIYKITQHIAGLLGILFGIHINVKERVYGKSSID